MIHINQIRAKLELLGAQLNGRKAVSRPFVGFPADITRRAWESQVSCRVLQETYFGQPNAILLARHTVD